MIMSRLRDIRQKAGYKTKEAAELLEVSLCTLRKIERGQIKPSPFLKLKIAMLYKCDITDI